MFSRLQSYGVGRLLLLNKSLFPYSTTTPAAVHAAQPQSHFLVAHLENLLGFSREEANSAIRKVTLWKSSKKDPSLVINFLENLGLNKTQIKRVVSSDPRLLLYDVDKTLRPKIRVRQELGLSPSELQKLLVNNRFFLSTGVDSCIKYSIELLRKLLGSDENVVKAIKSYAPLLNYKKVRNIESNMELLKKIGFSDAHIVKFVIKCPRRVIGDRDWLTGMLLKVENDFGISHESRMFYHALEVISGSKEATIDAKFGIFRSYGLTDEQIYAMFRSFPYVLVKSEDKIRATVNFFEGLGYSVEYLALRPVIFGLSLDKRIKPRCEVLKVLKQKNLIKKMPQILSFLNSSESKFESSFLLPYKDEIPDTYQSYIISVGRQNVKTTDLPKVVRELK